jgi:hypothetical protein
MRRLGKAAQLIAPADDARLGFSEVKLVIIDTAQQRKERVTTPSPEHTWPADDLGNMRLGARGLNLRASMR